MPGDPVFDRAYAVIMAGGSGTRFWPLSRRKRPKQLLSLFGRETLLEQTISRIRPVISPERIYVFTSQPVHREVVKRLRGIPRSQIVAEPVGRNTAPTIGLAAHEILRRDAQGVMVILPSDHIVLKPDAFRNALRTACRFGSTEGQSVILGLKPTRPETGYGYVRLGPLAARGRGHEVYRIRNFTEKPPLSLARRYLASGRYLWNGGMFIWRASTLIANLERYQPEMARLLARLAAAGGVRARAALRRIFPRLRKISIDYALMEKISDVYAVAADIGWSDVGSWEVIYELRPKDREGNVRTENSLLFESRGNLIYSRRKFVAAVGVENLVIVEADDALLVCRRERSQDVGKVVEELERRGWEEVL